MAATVQSTTLSVSRILAPMDNADAGGGGAGGDDCCRCFFEWPSIVSHCRLAAETAEKFLASFGVVGALSEQPPSLLLFESVVSVFSSFDAIGNGDVDLLE